MSDRPCVIPAIDAAGPKEQGIVVAVASADEMRSAPAAEPTAFPRRRLEVIKEVLPGDPTETLPGDRHNGGERSPVSLATHLAVAVHHGAGDAVGSVPNGSTEATALDHGGLADSRYAVTPRWATGLLERHIPRAVVLRVEYAELDLTRCA